MSIPGLTVTPAMLFSWSNMLVRSFGLLLLLPYVFVQLDLADALVWQLFTTILTIQLLLDFGFNASFIRGYGYIRGGLRQAEYRSQLKVDALPKHTDVDQQFLVNLRLVSRQTYLLLAFVSLLFMSTLGSWLLHQPISASASPNAAWQGWLFLIAVSGVRLFGNHYSSYLEGMDKIALLQGIGTVFAFLAVVSAAIALAIDGKLLSLVIAYNVWVVLQVLVLAVVVKKLRLTPSAKPERTGLSSLSAVLWQTSWRSGLGMMLTAGVTSLSGIVAANTTSQVFSTSYLFALQLMRTVASISQPPFYTKLPTLNRLYVSQAREEVVQIAQRGMRGVYGVFISVWLTLLLLGEPLFEAIGSQVAFPTNLVMLILGFGFFIERFAAMHLQIYTLSNHVRWHQVAMVSSALLAIAIVVLLPVFGDLAFPLGLLLANLLFPAWFNARLSYRVLDTRFLQFEKFTLVPFLTFLLGIGAVVLHV